MSLLTTVIDDKSPLISYDSTWLPGTSQDDNYAVDYYLGTFQKNSAPNGKATFSFNGTAFWIYGANRPNHGTYTVQVDSSNYPNINGSGNNLFQQSLFSTNVSQTMHTVNLINTGGSSGLYVDIDMIVWQSQVGSTGDQLDLEMVQDIDYRFQYQQSAWETTSSSSNLNLNLFTNGTGHVTDTSDASVSFIFTGEAVTLFGTSGPSNGPYLAQMDGSQAVTYNATNAYPTNYGVVIYHADNLGPGSHQLVLTNLPAASGQCLTVDYAHLWTLANSSSTTTPSATITSCTSSSINLQNTLSPGAIAGLIVEGVVMVLAAAAALFFYRRWKVALATPHTLYTPLYRSPETTTANGTGIAPSLETRSNPSSRQIISSQPLAAVGRSNRQLDTSGAVSGPPDSQNVAEGAASSTRLPNAGQVPRRRPLPDALGRELPQPEGFSALHRASELPPGYDTAVRSTDV